jgi:hypothetical protein
MSDQTLMSIVGGIVEQLVLGDYDRVIGLSKKTRVTSEQLARVIREYGRKLTMPPGHDYQDLDAVRVTGASVPTWSVRVPLWTEEEGRSDLTLELTISLAPRPSIELDDLHVL